MDLLVIVVNWNTRDLLAQCLESVYANPPDCDYEVLVVDNGSTDGSPAVIRERFPNVRLIGNSANVGFARANNQGIRASSGRSVLLLNSDTIVQSGALAQMVACMDSNPQAGLLGANILNPDGTPQRCYGKFPSVVSEAAYAWGLENRFPFKYRFGGTGTIRDEFVETDWVLGAAMLVRRQVLDQVGLLDESYFMYSEEIDLAYRIKKAGWKVCVLRDAEIIHLGGQSTKQVPAEMKAQLFRSKVKYFRKHHGEIPAGIVKRIFLSSVFARKWIYRIVGQRQKSMLWADSMRHFAGT